MNKGHISRLYIFAKDTDAPDVIKGFKFQELKTLEIWLFNKVNGINEDIYCDYEEDIFQRDLKEFRSTFKQLKLYSSKNFSFSSSEITKALAHFFMLFVKGDYLLDDPLFIFETNTSIAANRGDNDAELLKKWVNNQDNLPDELLMQCVKKLKSIIDEYIDGQHLALTKNGDQVELDIAKDVYNALPQETWKQFAKSIRWIFGGVSSEVAIETSIRNSLQLISRLTFPINKDDYSKVFDRLRAIVGDKSIANSPEDRVLTNNLLDQQLLSLGDKSDKVYAQAFDLWKSIKSIDYFNIGEFYQVLFAAKHCRRNRYLKEHTTIWLNLLSQFISNLNIIAYLRREAIYEIIWLTLRPSYEEPPQNSLEGLEEWVLEYFSNFEAYYDPSSIEDTHNLLTVIVTSQKLNLIKFDEGQIVEWIDRFDVFIRECKATAKDKNIYCSLLELEAFSYINKHTFGMGENNLDKAKAVLEEIILELPNAPLFPVSHLSKKIDGIYEYAIYFKLDNKIKLVEEYSEKLLPYVQQREGYFSSAKRYIELGLKYLNSTNPKNVLKALNLFHKAKDFYQNEATYEGFILTVINISKLYAAIGLNLAAKYYSLSAIWFCFNNGEPKLYKRINDAYAMLLHSDFKQGSWMSSLYDFENLISAKSEFDTEGFDPSVDTILRQSFAEISFILALTPIISSQFITFIDYEKNRMGNLYSNFLKDNVNFIEMERSKIGLAELIALRLDNPPINDIGAKRLISWKAFGSNWNVVLHNNFIHNSIGEEFAALIQIIQADIALSEVDFHLIKSSIKIEVELIDVPKGPEQLPSNNEYIWKVYLPLLKSKEPVDKQMHYTAITASFYIILNELSLLPNDKFKQLFESLFNNSLSNKALTINAYQRAYRDLFSEEKFNASMREKFKSEILSIEQYESEILTWINSESSLYNLPNSLENISNRYRSCLKVIYLTLRRLKDSIEFKSKIDTLKLKGWLDWQIILALYNNLIDLKAKYLVQQNGKSYTGDEEWLDDFQKVFHEIRFKDETETYLQLPLDEIIGENLDSQLEYVPIHVLRSFGLETKSRFPNPNAIREVLIENFKFNLDEVYGQEIFRTLTYNQIERVLSLAEDVSFEPNDGNIVGVMILSFNDPALACLAYQDLIENALQYDVLVRIKERQDKIDLKIIINHQNIELNIKDLNYSKSKLAAFKNVKGGGPKIILLIGYPPAESNQILMPRGISPLVVTWLLED